MDWRSQGVLLSARRHGENAAIIDVFTSEFGRHAGVVRGGAGRKMAPILQPGAQLDVSWRARLEGHLGAFTVEPIKSRAAAVMGDRKALAGLNALCGLLQFALAERDPHPDLRPSGRKRSVAAGLRSVGAGFARGVGVRLGPFIMRCDGLHARTDLRIATHRACGLSPRGGGVGVALVVVAELLARGRRRFFRRRSGCFGHDRPLPIDTDGPATG